MFLTRKRVHQPTQADSDQYEHGEGPRGVFKAFEWIAPTQRAERQGDDHRKKQQRLKVRQMQRHHPGHALRLRADTLLQAMREAVAQVLMRPIATAAAVPDARMLLAEFRQL